MTLKNKQQKGFTLTTPMPKTTAGDLDKKRIAGSNDLKQSTALVKGFTLIEVLVVISIISFLASILLVNIKVAQMKAIDSKNIQSATVLNDAITLYFQDHGSYPTTGLNVVNGNNPGQTIYWSSSKDPTWQSGLGTALQTYINQMPGQTTNFGPFPGVTNYSVAYGATDSTYNNYGDNPVDSWCGEALNLPQGKHFCYCYEKSSYIIQVPLNNPADTSINSVDQTGFFNTYIGGNLWYSTVPTTQMWPGPPVVPYTCN